MPNKHATQGRLLIAELKRRPKTQKLWSAEELRLLADLYPSRPTPEVAHAIGRPIPSVQKMAQMRGIGKSKEYMEAKWRRDGEMLRELGAHSRFERKHGHSTKKQKGAVYNAWQSMLRRCESPAHKSYDAYGGRGITVCERWHEFTAFLQDMGDRPAGTTIGRIDNNGNYEPGNCRWETPVQQGNNRRTNRPLTAFGRTQNIGQWAREIGIALDTLAKRIDDSGWPVEMALTKPVANCGPGKGKRS